MMMPCHSIYRYRQRIVMELIRHAIVTLCWLWLWLCITYCDLCDRFAQVVRTFFNEIRMGSHEGCCQHQVNGNRSPLPIMQSNKIHRCRQTRFKGTVPDSFQCFMMVCRYAIQWGVGPLWGRVFHRLQGLQAPTCRCCVSGAGASAATGNHHCYSCSFLNSVRNFVSQ